MKDLSEHVGAVTDTDTFNAVVMKIRTGLQGRTNNVVQRNLLLASYICREFNHLNAGQRKSAMQSSL